jgi:hypothetical protein
MHHLSDPSTQISDREERKRKHQLATGESIHGIDPALTMCRFADATGLRKSPSPFGLVGILANWHLESQGPKCGVTARRLSPPGGLVLPSRLDAKSSGTIVIAPEESKLVERASRFHASAQG